MGLCAGDGPGEVDVVGTGHDVRPSGLAHVERSGNGDVEITPIGQQSGGGGVVAEIELGRGSNGAGGEEKGAAVYAQGPGETVGGIVEGKGSCTDIVKAARTGACGGVADGSADQEVARSADIHRSTARAAEIEVAAEGGKRGVVDVEVVNRAAAGDGAGEIERGRAADDGDANRAAPEGYGIGNGD